MAFITDEYGWKDMHIVLAGRPVTGVTGVNYKLSRPVTKIYASGTKAQSRYQGNEDCTGDIGLLQSEVEALQEAVPAGKNITDLVFDVIVHFSKSPTSRQKTDILKDCVITEIPKGMEQNAANMVIKLPIDIADIIYNA